MNIVKTLIHHRWLGKAGRLALLVCAGGGGLALAEEALERWETVMRDRDRQVQLNRGTVIDAGDGVKVAWARIVFDERRQAADGGRETAYASIRALNRYDCKARTFVTVKREYLGPDLLIAKEERPPAQTPQTLRPGSVDERLWREVCGPATVNELQRVVREADKAAGPTIR